MYARLRWDTGDEKNTDWHILKMSIHESLKAKIGLLFSVYNISKNYLTFYDSWIDIYKICQSVFFSSPVSHLSGHGKTGECLKAP